MKQSWIKRIFSFVLALVMVLGMVPAGVIHMPHAHAATDTSKYDLVIDFDYQTENNIKTPEQAMELVKDESLSDMSQPVLARSVYDGDVDELREWLEDPSDITQIIQLQEDVKIITGDAFETIKITGDKVLDLNGYTLEVWDASNGKSTRRPGLGTIPFAGADQKTTVSNHHSYIFQISQGATLTVIDSGGTEEAPGRIYANATMINHQRWDFLYYTHRDIFHVLDGNLVIYGGEFQAGRQKDQLKSNFSWTKLKNVIGQAVVLGTNILEYTSGISAAEAADLDLKEELFLSKDNKDTDGDSDDGKGDKGATAKKTGESGTQDTKKDTPASAGTQGDKSQQAEQTVAQKQNGKNNGTQDGASKGDQSGENKANKDKPAKEEGRWTQLAKSEKAIASAKWDKDKIGNMVNSAFDLVEGIAGLLGTDERSRATACIQGTVAKVSNGGTLVIYDGYFIGHGSTPNVRNAVIEVETSNVKNTNPQSLHYGKNTGGYVYVYGGTFDAMTGANVFNMVVTKTKQKQFTYTTDSSGNIVATEVTLPKHETQNMQVLRYDPASLDEWQAGYDAIDASDTAALEAYPNPEMVNTANVVVRGGTFRCYYEPIIMSVLENKKEGSWCPDCQKYDDSCDGIDHHIFNGTSGAVNLGVASFDQDLIKDGRIQIVDVYGQGKLVLLDGGEPIYPDGEPASGNNNSYQTEGGFRQYRLFCGDTELRVSSYLMVYPNDAKTNSSNSMALRTYWGTGDDLSDMWDSATPKEEKEWPADMDNIRAPYSSNEKYIEFVFDDNENDGDGISANYYVIPNLKNTDPMGSNLNSSNVWYYNVPVDANEEPIVPKVRYFDYDNLLQSGQDVEYATNIKWFNYKVYRVDPLSRENISENGIPCENDDNPLIEVCYGASPDSLKCKLPLLYLEEQIKARVPGWDGYDSGEMYRIVFSVEEHLAYGFNTESEFDNTMTKASAESSILFLCVSKDELKKENYTNPNTGKESVHYVPDWTPLHFTTDEVMAGETATVNLVEGQTGLVDWVGDKVFDVYYQWWEVDENGNDIRLLAGTDNIWVAQDTVGKNNHRPSNWIIDEDGNGINDELYANTLDPASAAATQYTYFPNGLPKNTENPEKSGALWSHEMLHMYTLETTGQNEGLKARPNESLNMGNNNAFWGNTDSCYIPEDMAGKYLQVRVIAVNCQYPTYYDNKQTYKSHVIPITGVAIPGFDQVTPEPLNGNEHGGYSKLGDVYKDTVPTFSFSALPLDEELRDQGYTLELTTIDKVDGKVVATIYDGKPYTPKEYGEHELRMIITMVDAAGRRLNSLTQVFTFNMRFKPMFTKLTPNASKAELEAGVKDMGNTAVHTLTFEYEPLPQFMYDQGYRQHFRIDGTNTGSGSEVTVQEYENGAKVSLNGLYYNYSIKPIIELYNIYGEEVAETSITYKLSPTVGLCFTGLTPSVTAAQIANKVADLGTVYEPVTVSYDDVVIPSWVDSTVARLYSASMDVYRDGEHLDRYLFDRGEKSYTATVFGDYEIVLTQNIINAGGYHEETFTYKFTYAAPELKFTNLTPAPTAAEYEAGKKDLGLVSAPTVFSYELLTLTEQQIAVGYKLSASMDIYDAEGNKVTGIGGTVNDNVFSYTHSLLGEYRIVLKQTLYCQVEEGGGVSYSESVEFEYTVNQTNDYLLAFTGFEPYQPTDEELAAGLTELGTISSRAVFSFTHTTVPQWMLNNGYTVEAWIYDYQNGEQVGYGSNYPVSAGGGHELIAKAELLDPSGNVVQSISHKFTCYVDPAVPESISITANYYTAEVNGFTLYGDNTYVVMSVDEWITLTTTVLPLEAYQDVTWTSSDESVATVDANGKITAVGPGRASIKITDPTGLVSTNFSVTVGKPADVGDVCVGFTAIPVGMYLAQGSEEPTAEQPEDNYIYHKAATTEGDPNEIIIHNFSSDSGLYVTPDIKLVLEGENDIDIYASGKVTTSGSGNITGSISCTMAQLNGTGTVYGDVSIRNGTDSLSVMVNSRMDVTGQLYVEHGSIAIRSGGYVGYASADAVTVTSGGEAGEIFSEGAVQINEGGISGKIVSYSTVTVNGTVNGSISASGTLNISGTVIATNCGAYEALSGKTITVNDGAKVFLQQDEDAYYPLVSCSFIGIGITDMTTASAITDDRQIVAFNKDDLDSYCAIALGGAEFSNMIFLNDVYMLHDEYLGSDDTAVSTSWDYSSEEGYVRLLDYDESGMWLIVEGYNNTNATMELYDYDITLDGWSDMVVGSVRGYGNSTLTIPDDSISLIIQGSGLSGVTMDYENHLIEVGDSESDLDVWQEYWHGDYDLSGYAYVKISHKHNMTHHEAVASTCTEDGILEHYECTTCGEWFADANGNEKLNNIVDWCPGHTDAVSCTLPSWCTVCGEYIRDAGNHMWDNPECMDGTCWICGETREASMDHSINADDTTVVTEASCSQEGKMTGWCQMCGQEMEVITPKLAHDYTEGTCAAPGSCTVCGEVNTETIEHVLDEGVVTKQPNCTEEGVLTKTCSICGSTVEEPIAIDGDVHTYADATCTAPRTCTGCGITEGVKLAHNLDEGVVTKQPTCSAEGILKRTCSDCGETVEEAIPMTDHNITSVATCSEPAKCGDCGLYIGLALAHNWVDATCDAPQTCANCGATEGSALGHNWAEATCTSPKRCASCGVTEGEALGHDWAEASCTEPKTCNRCLLMDGSVLGHTWDVSDCTQARTCTVCGETAEAGFHTITATDTQHNGTCEVCGMTIYGASHTFGDDEFCDVCGYEHTHSLTHVPAKDATCTTTGNVEYWTCSVCGNSYSDESAATLITETTIPATGHSWNEATCITPKTCSVCGETEGEALGHNMVDGTCTRCGYSETVGGPQIISQPVDYVGLVGDTATFTVVAEGEDLTYQWYYYDTEASEWKKSTGATSATLNVEFKAYRNNQQYRCEISDSDGNTLTTDIVRIVAKVVDLVITDHPDDYFGAVNDNVTMTVEATGNGLTYQWYYSDDAGATWKVSGSPGFATATLQPILRAYRDGYQFYCVVTDIFGNTAQSNVASMVVKASDVIITQQPDDVTDGVLDQLQTFKVTATGDNLEYRWEFSSDGGETWQPSWNQGYNADTLTVRLYASRSGYLYRCKITSGLKTVVYTDPVELKLQAPSVAIVKQPTNVAVVSGKTIKFQVEATGTNLTYVWYRSNDKGATWTQTFLSGYNTNTLSFAASNSRAALYKCKITDGSGKVVWTDNAKLQILSAELKILTQPVNVTCANGATAAFTVEAQGDTLKYQWYSSADGGATWTASYMTGYNTATFSFAVNATRASRLYKCVITDAGGNTVETNYVSVTIG